MLGGVPNACKVSHSVRMEEVVCQPMETVWFTRHWEYVLGVGVDMIWSTIGALSYPQGVVSSSLPIDVSACLTTFKLGILYALPKSRTVRPTTELVVSCARPLFTSGITYVEQFLLSAHNMIQALEGVWSATVDTLSTKILALVAEEQTLVLVMILKEGVFTA